MVNRRGGGEWEKEGVKVMRKGESGVGGIGGWEKERERKEEEGSETGEVGKRRGGGGVEKEVRGRQWRKGDQGEGEK